MAAFGNKHGGIREKTSFVGMVGRESKKKSGKQGIHHHPQISQLGDSVAGGLPADFPKRKAGC